MVREVERILSRASAAGQPQAQLPEEHEVQRPRSEADRLRAVPDGQDLREEDAERSHQEAAGHRLQVLAEAPTVEEVLQPVKGLDEEQRKSGGDQPEEQIERQFPGADQTVRWARRRKGDRPGCAREIAAAVTEEKTTNPKEAASNSRRITSRAKMTPAMGALKVAEMPPAAPQATSSRMRLSGKRSSLAQARTQGRADLHDGTFPAGRAAATDAERRGQGLHQGHPRPDASALGRHREHDLRHAVPFGLACEVVGQQADQKPAQGRDRG